MDRDNSQDHVWTPESTDTSQYSAVTSSAPLTSAADVLSSGASLQAYPDTRYVTGNFQPSQIPQHFSVSSQGYRIAASQQQLYQQPRPSYERISPVDIHGDNMPTYSTMQPADGSHMIAAATVDSSTLQASPYHVQHVVLNEEAQVQRVISPVDCTVSQSALGLHRHDSHHEAEPAPARAPASLPSGSLTHHYQPVPVSRHPSFSSGEVTTSGGQNGEGLDQETNQAISSISSISNPIHHSQLMTNHTHKTDQDDINGEPDTTQDDNEDYQDTVRVSRRFGDLSRSDTSDQAIHSTVMSSSAHSMPSTSNQVINHAMGSNSRLTSTQDTVLNGVRESTMELQSEQRIESSRLVDSSVIPPQLGNPNMQNVVLVDVGTIRVQDSLTDEDEDIQNTMQPVRKSNRLAEMENEPSWHRPEYQHKVYSINEMWCEECMRAYSPECPFHRLQVIPDKVVLSRAWSSLPPMLQIFRFGESGGTELGVFAKRQIPKLTQFGPFIGELVDSQEKVTNKSLLLMLEKPGGQVAYFETSNENKCSWMMFVRPAESYAEQNMVVFQFGQDLYFSVTKVIEAKAELKVWYANHYAERLGVRVHRMTQDDIDELDQQECRFPCYECNKRFKTSALLQKHLTSHEESNLNKDDEDFKDHAESQDISKKFLFAPNVLKKRGKAVPKLKENGETSGYQWKKKSTSIYLNKTLKKYQKRHDSEAIRKTIQSLYRRKGKESGGNEWICTNCDLTFDNSNLLNLHTLTHAAEDVGLEEIRKFAFDLGEMTQSHIMTAQPSLDTTILNGSSILTLETCNLACPVCHAQFSNKRDLIEHASEHGKARKNETFEKPHKCLKCWKAFSTQDRLQRHMLCHGDEDSKPLQCDVCFKRFMNNSALSCHMKTHSDKKYYVCPICLVGFDQTNVMREHVVSHAVDGMYQCPKCTRVFDDFLVLRKHIRGFHSDKHFPCLQCNKIFPRPDKLKLHMLKHSSHREFMCETCGRQFKRKDKLKEHIKRMHSMEREAKIAARGDKPYKKFTPKVSPTDYHRFIYKCHCCLLGFKRRGMLVNHLAKRHPDIKPDSVPELNLPILKTQRDYYCQYCEKVYKSSSKRKAHILKNHPGAELPMSSRKKMIFIENHTVPNPTYSQTVGSITTMPHSCDFCHKQYASKAKLTQHQRKKHTDLVPALPERRKREAKEEYQDIPMQQETPVQQIVDARYDPETIQTVQSVQAAIAAHQTEMPTADLLTQAMSELTQTLAEYRQPGGEIHIPAHLARAAGPAMLQVQTPGHLQHSTIELSHLGQTLAHTHFATQQAPLTVQVAQVAMSSAAPIEHIQTQQQPAPSVSPPQQQATNVPTQAIVVNASSGQTIPVTLANAYLARNWQNYTQYR